MLPILLVCAVALAASPPAASLDLKYLEWTYREADDRNDSIPKTLESLQLLVSKINAEVAYERLKSWCNSTEHLQSEDTREVGEKDPAEVHAKADKIMMVIKRSLREPKVNDYSEYVYRDLANFADGSDDCRTSNALRITYLLRDDSNGLRPLVPFLEHYGAIKFGRCSKKKAVTKMLKKNPDDLYEMVLDEFFPAVVGLRGAQPSDGEVLDKLRSLNWEGDKVHFDQALDVAKKWKDHLVATVKNSLDLISGILCRACTMFMDERRHPLDLVALAYAFTELYSPFSNEIQKGLEYRRLCLMWRQSVMTSGEIQEMFRERLEQLGE